MKFLALKNNFKIFGLNEAKTLGHVLKLDIARRILELLQESPHYYEEVAKKIYPYQKPSTNAHHHLKRIRSIGFLELGGKPHKTQKSINISYKAPQIFVIVPDKLKKKFKKSKKLQKLLNELSED